MTGSSPRIALLRKIPLGMVFGLAVLAGLVSRPKPEFRTGARDPFHDVKPMASWRVREAEQPGSVEFTGGGYRAVVSGSGMEFEGEGVFVRTKAARVEQGGRGVGFAEGTASHPAFARARIDRGSLAEEYVFENRRVEQIFRIPQPLGEGCLRMVVAVETNLGGRVETIERGSSGWKETPLERGGIVFYDSKGDRKLAYHGAVAIDAGGRSIDLDPRHEAGAIVLEVPEEFMAMAEFPLLIDPWFELAFSATGTGIASGQDPSLALDATGNPVVAWSANSEIYLRRWDGAAWVELGGSATGGGISGSPGFIMASTLPSIAVDPSGNPVVAWQEEDPGTLPRIYLRRWNGTSWVELGGSATGGGVSATAGASRYPRLALDAGGNPVVAWTDTTNGNFEIYLRRWNGAAWVELGNSATGGGISANAGGSGVTVRGLELRLDPIGFPVVAWHDNTSGVLQVNLKRWTGTAWVELGGSATGGGISQSAVAAGVPSLALDAFGDPMVAWTETIGGGNNEIYVKHWSGIGWLELGGSATGGGISANSGLSVFPSLAANDSGNPVVAWRDDTSGGIPEVYLRLWNGVSWVELAGSGTGGGMSSSTGLSDVPSLALDGTGNPVVAWEESSNYIHLRRWYQNAPTGLGQTRSNGRTFIDIGGATNEDTVNFTSTVTSDNVGGGPLPVRLQVEVRPVGASFMGQPSGQSPFSASGAPATAVVEGLANGGYHWRARTVDSLGQASQWIPFGGNAESQADFIVSSAAPTPPQTFVDASDDCGLLGADLLAPLGVLWLLRRRRVRRRARS